MDLEKDLDTLERHTLWLPKYQGVNFEMLTIMGSLIYYVDFKKMPLVFRDERDEMLGVFDYIYLYCANGELEEEFKYNFQNLEGIGDKILGIIERLDFESLIKNTSFSSKFGELSGFEDYLDGLKDFIIKAVSKYVNIETTNLLTYKMF